VIGDFDPGPLSIFTAGTAINLQMLAPYVAQDVTPTSNIVLAWIYIAVSVGLVLISLRLKRKAGAWLIGFSGLGYIAYATVAAFIVISNRLDSFGIALQGHTTLPMMIGSIHVDASLQFGYYLAYVAGVMCICLAFFRGLMKDKYEIEKQTRNNIERQNVR
jgi:hypothetical protein